MKVILEWNDCTATAHKKEAPVSFEGGASMNSAMFIFRSVDSVFAIYKILHRTARLSFYHFVSLADTRRTPKVKQSVISRLLFLLSRECHIDPMYSRVYVNRHRCIPRPMVTMT
jgi:hypothetical protein